MHNLEPSLVTWNYENNRSLRVVIWSQDFPLSYLVQPLERLKYIVEYIPLPTYFHNLEIYKVSIYYIYSTLKL